MIPSIFSQGNTQGASGAASGQNMPAGLGSLFAMLFNRNLNSGESSTLFSALSTQGTDISFTNQDISSISQSPLGAMQDMTASDFISLEKTKFDVKTLDQTFTNLFHAVENIEAAAIDIPEMDMALEASYESIQATITQLRVTLSQQESISVQSTNDLQAAYTELGIPAEEAAEMAERVEAAFDMMRNYLGIEETEEASETGFNLASLFNTETIDKSVTATAQITEINQKIARSSVVASLENGRHFTQVENISNKVMQGSELIDDTLAENTEPRQKALQRTAEEALPKTEPAANTSQPLQQGEVERVQQKEIDNRRTPQTVRAEASDSLPEPTQGKHLIGVRFDAQGNPQTTYTAAATTSDATLDLDTGTDADLDQEGGDPAEAATRILKPSTQNTQSASATQTAFNALLTKASVTTQTSIHMRTLAENGGGEVKFKLYPEELGEVEVELEIQNGRIRGSIAVERSEVADHLARELHKLQQSLEDAGLSFSEQGLDFYVKDENSGQEQHGQPGREDEQGEDDTLLAREENQQTAAPWVNPESVVDISA